MKALPFLALAVLAVPVSAQTDAANALMSAAALKCSFPWVAQNEWTGRSPTPIVKEQEFDFRIAEIDIYEGRARIVGELGSAALAVSTGVNLINFIERTAAGAINLTTVFAARDEKGRFKAVNSRHLPDPVGATPFPSQNYGYCEPT